MAADDSDTGTFKTIANRALSVHAPQFKDAQQSVGEHIFEKYIFLLVTFFLFDK